VLVVTGRTEEAVPLLEESVAIQRGEERGGSSGPHPMLGYALVNLGWARLGLDGVDAAGEIFRQALPAAGEADPQVRARALEGLAAVALHTGDSETGGTLFGGAEAVRRSIGIGVWLTDQATHAETEAQLQAALGPSAYAAAFDEGLRLAADDLDRLAAASESPSAAGPTEAGPAVLDPVRARRPGRLLAARPDRLRGARRRLPGALAQATAAAMPLVTFTRSS
jgi:hypothetical protein